MVPTEKHRMELQDIANDIESLKRRYDRVKQSNEKHSNKYLDFQKIFSENKSIYIIQGIICIAALVFDFWVTSTSIEYLTNVINVNSVYLAVLFSIIDAGVAILASGKLSGDDPLKVKKYKRLFRPVLVILGIVKAILFVSLIISQEESTYTGIVSIFANSAILQAVIIQFVFIATVYFILGIASIGLWFIFGRLYFQFWKFLLASPYIYENKIIKKQNDLKAAAQYHKIDYSSLSNDNII